MVRRCRSAMAELCVGGVSADPAQSIQMPMPPWGVFLFQV